MTRLFPLRPGAGSAGRFQQTIVLPPPATPTAAACTCANVSIAWATSADPAHAITPAMAPAALAARGTICPDTVWEWEIDWTGESAAFPVLTQVGASTWTVAAADVGTATVTGTAACGGVSFQLGPAVLDVVPRIAPLFIVQWYLPVSEYCWGPLELPAGVENVSIVGLTAWGPRPGDNTGCGLNELISDVNDSGDVSLLNSWGDPATHAVVAVRRGTPGMEGGHDGCTFVDHSDGGDDAWYLNAAALNFEIDPGATIGCAIVLLDLDTSIGPRRVLCWWYTCV